MLINELASIDFALVYDQPIRSLGLQHLSARFPPEWAEVLLISQHEFSILNRDHSVFKQVTEAAWQQIVEIVPDFDDKQLTMPDIQSPELAAAWFMYFRSQDDEFWNALRDNYPRYYAALFDLIHLPADGRILLWRGEILGVQEISPSGATLVRKRLSRGAESPIKLPNDESWWFHSLGTVDEH